MIFFFLALTSYIDINYDFSVFLRIYNKVLKYPGERHRLVTIKHEHPEVREVGIKPY